MKKLIAFLLSSLLLILPLSACGSDGTSVTVRLNEVTHSVFYAPLYLAIENGYFEENGITVELTNGGGADKSMTAVLSGTADVGLMGPESAIYDYNQGQNGYPVVFGQLTQKDGSFLVSRNEEPDFCWEDLEGKEILAGRKGGVPAMTFEYLINEHGLYNGENVTLNFDVQFNLMTAAFLNGTADYCTVFEPTASEYEKEGKWHIVASVGEGSGEIPYTSFIAKQSYINENKDVINGFLKAILKAIDYIGTHTTTEVATAIVPQFPSTTIESIATSVDSYKKIQAWTTDLKMTESSFTRLQDIMERAGELDKRVEFSKLVNNDYAAEANR